MKRNLRTQLAFSCLLICSATAVQGEPLLNGVAINTEFGEERFIAALYADDLSSDNQEILNSSGHRRIELKVLADSISARGINSMWVEGMAINNSNDELESQADNLAALNNMIRQRLEADDVLTFDAPPGEGMRVELNGVELGVIDSPDFFPMLLRTWIGSIPLSSDFRNGLLANGDVDGDLRDRYAAITPSDDRREVIAGWLEEAASEVADAGPDVPAPDGDVDAPPSGDGSSESEAADEESQVASESEPEPEPEPAEQQAAEAETEPEPEPEPEPASEPEPEPEPEPAVAEAEEEAAAEAEEEEQEQEQEDLVTAASVLQRQQYVSDVMREVLSNMRYPRRAQQRRQEGSIRLAVTVNAGGNLQDIQIVDESSYTLLNREAVESVERSEPLPSVPEDLAEENMTFNIPITFRLQ